MSDYQAYFADIISSVLSGRLSRAEAAADVARTIGIDEIQGDSQSLLTNCEWALRHADEPHFFTPEQELRYLLACLNGQAEFSTARRDAALRP